MAIDWKEKCNIRNTINLRSISRRFLVRTWYYVGRAGSKGENHKMISAALYHGLFIFFPFCLCLFSFQYIYVNFLSYPSLCSFSYLYLLHLFFFDMSMLLAPWYKQASIVNGYHSQSGASSTSSPTIIKKYLFLNQHIHKVLYLIW